MDALSSSGTLQQDGDGWERVIQVVSGSQSVVGYNIWCGRCVG